MRDLVGNREYRFSRVAALCTEANKHGDACRKTFLVHYLCVTVDSFQEIIQGHLLYMYNKGAIILCRAHLHNNDIPVLHA